MQGTRDYSPVDARIRKGQVQAKDGQDAFLSNFCGVAPPRLAIKRLAAATIRECLFCFFRQKLCWGLQSNKIG